MYNIFYAITYYNYINYLLPLKAYKKFFTPCNPAAKN